MFFLFQSFSDAVKLLTVENVSVFGLLLFFIGYLIWQNQVLKNKVSEIVNEHKKDLKENNKDMVEMVNKYHTFVEQLSSLTRGRR